MLNNNDRRKGLILSGFNQKSYGKFNNKKKAKYELSDLVLDLNRSAEITTVNDDFDISDDSFKVDNEGEVQNSEEAKELGKVTSNNSDLDISDAPYGKSGLVNISISDNEDSDITMSSPAKPISQTPKKSKISRSNGGILADISPVVVNTYKNEVSEKRLSMKSISNVPLFQRNESAGGLNQFRNRSSLSSNNSKRWSMLSFSNNEENKENISSTAMSRSKRFSTISATSSTLEKIKRMSITSSSNESNKTKRFSIGSQISVTSSSQSSFTKNMSRSGNPVSTVSISTHDGSTDSINNQQVVTPGIVGVSTNITMNTVNGSTAAKRRDIGYGSRDNTSHLKSVHGNLERPSLSSLSSSSTQQPLHKKPSRLGPNAISHHRKDSDTFSVMSTNSLRSNRSLFRFSKIFSSKAPASNAVTSPNTSNVQGNHIPYANHNSNGLYTDNESIRSVKPRSSFNDFRKSFLSMGLTKKDSMGDLKSKKSISTLNKFGNNTGAGGNRYGVDKSKISLPVPHSESIARLNERLKHSSSVLSINTNFSVSTNNGYINEENENTAAIEELTQLVQLTSFKRIVQFEEFLDGLNLKEDEILIKFAEASYSEVFAIKNIQTNKVVKIFKIIPLEKEGNSNIDETDKLSESTTSISDVVQELKITKILSQQEGFIKLLNSTFIQGTYPKLIQTLWNDYNHHHRSQNPNPSQFQSSQNYIVLELEYGGIDLEKFDIKDWITAKSIFWSIISLLSKSEKEIGFEHRDLHWGNVVLKTIKKDNKTVEELNIIEEEFRDLSIDDINVDHEEHIEVKLIDFTLTRLQENGQEVLFTKLDNAELFEGEGDYQFDIYRYMKTELSSNQKNDAIDWSVSNLRTNLYWVHYLLDKLVYHKGLKIDTKDQDFQDLIFLHESLDPSTKQSNGNQIAAFKKEEKVQGQSRVLANFKDFKDSNDVLRFGSFYDLK